MPNDSMNLALVVGTSALINSTYAISKGNDVVVPLVGSGIMFGGLTLVGALTNKWELPIAFAWVFLLASIVGRGIPLITASSNIAKAKRNIETGKAAATGAAAGALSGLR